MILLSILVIIGLMNVVPILAIDDDLFEENDTAQNATNLGFLQYNDLIQNDNDWYYINATIGAKYGINLNWDEFSGNTPTITLYDKNMNHELYFTYETWRSNSKIQMAYSGKMYIMISGSNSGTKYSLKIEQLSMGGSIIDDFYENNNKYENASNLDIGNYSNLILLDIDYYKINTEARHNYKITLLCENDTDFNLCEIYKTFTGEYTTLQIDDNTISGKLEIIIPSTKSGDNFFFVSSASYYGFNYSLTIEETEEIPTSRVNPQNSISGYNVVVFNSFLFIGTIIYLSLIKRNHHLII